MIAIAVVIAISLTTLFGEEKIIGKFVAVIQEDGIRDLRDVTWVGDYIYAAGAGTAKGDGLTIWNVSEPSEPVLVAEEGTGLSFARGVVVSEGIAFVTGRDSSSVVSIDIADPANPKTMHVLNNARLLGARGIAILGHHLIIACGLHPSTDKGTQGIAVIDISNPSNLKMVARLDESDDPRIVSGGSVVVDAERHIAFVSMYRHNGVMAFDISVPDKPRLLSVFDSKDIENARGLSLRGHVLIVSGSSSMSIVAVDTHRPDAPVQLGELRDPALRGARGNALISEYNLLVVSARGGTSVLVDVFDPKRMAVRQVVGRHPGLYGVSVLGSYYAHASAASGSLVIGKIMEK